MSYTVRELRLLYEAIPSVLADCCKLDMRPNVYYEGQEFRIIYDENEKAFMNLDSMELIPAGDFKPNEMKQVQRIHVIEQFSFSAHFQISLKYNDLIMVKTIFRLF